MKKTIKISDIFLLCSISGLSALFVYFPLTNTDIWWHLAAAREMIVTKNFLYSDPFAYSLDNPQWIDLHWFSQMLFYGIFTLFSSTGLVMFKCIIVCLISLILSFSNHSKQGTLLTSVIFALLIFEMRMLALVRPIILTLLYMGIFFWAFEHYLVHRNKKYLLLLIPIQILWTNSQGLFILGLLIAGCYAVGEWLQKFTEKKHSKHSLLVEIKNSFPVKLIAAFGLLLSSCLMNPYGFSGFFFPFKLFKRIEPGLENIYSHNVSENIPLMDLSGKDQRYIYIYFIVLVLSIISFSLNKKSFRWAHIFLSAVFLYLAFIAKRNSILYAVIIPPILGFNFSMGYYACKSEKSVRRFPKTFLVTGKYMIVSAIILAFLLRTYLSVAMLKIYPSKQTVSPFRVPVEAVQYLKAHPVPGNIFNSIRYGGYLIWHFFPDKKVFIDGRLIIRSERFFSDYLKILDNPPLFPSAMDTYDITYVVLPIAIFPRFMPLVRWLYKSDMWELVFVNGESVVFIKRNINIYRTFDLDSREDIQYITNSIDERWKNDSSIRKEAQGYFTDFIAAVRE